MKTIFLCVTLLLAGLSSQAQSSVVSLGIILSDIQSATFRDGLKESVSGNNDKSKDQRLNLLNNTTSQIKKISSTSTEFKSLYEELYSNQAITALASSNLDSHPSKVSPSANSPKEKYISNLVIYQIDPR